MSYRNSISEQIEDHGIKVFNAVSSIIEKDRVLFFNKNGNVCGECRFFYNGVNILVEDFDYRDKLTKGK